MSTPESVSFVSPRPTTLIDAIVAAGRLYRQQLRTLLGASLALQALKVAVVFLGFALFGGAGLAGGGQISAAMLVLNALIFARLAVDVRAGDPPRGPLDLLRRTLPARSGIVWLFLLYAVGVFYGQALGYLPKALKAEPSSATTVNVSVYLGTLAIIMIPLVLWVLAVPAKVAQGLSVRDALSVSRQLTRRALGTALMLVLFSWFVVQLMPALADSLVGRSAPIHQWWITEGVISSFIAPVLGLTAPLLMFGLIDEYGSVKPTPERKFEEMLSVFVRPSKGAEPWRAPKGAPPAERVRDRPVGLERDRLRSIQRRLLTVILAAFVFAVVVPVGFALGVGVEGHGDAVVRVLMGTLLVSLALIFDAGLIPVMRKLDQRARAGTAVEAEVARVVTYRPTVFHLGLRLQILRYTVVDGSVLEACSQIRDVTLVPGQAVRARYDPADPEWVAVEKKLDAQLRHVTIVSRGLMVFGAASLLAGVIGSGA